MLGVATTTASIFHTLSFAETTRIKLHAFSSQSAVESLNRIVDEIVLSPRMAFLMSGKIFSYLTSVFLSFDLTTKEFMRSMRYCMLEHFSRGNAFAVCSPSHTRAENAVEELSHQDIETIRRLKSFRPYVESMSNPTDIIGILSDDVYFANALKSLIRDLRVYFVNFHCFIRLLLTLARELPQAPLGKQLRELYSLCSERNVVETEEFIKSWQYLELMSRQELAKLLEKGCDTLIEFEKNLNSSCREEMDVYVLKETGKFVGETVDDLIELREELMQAPVAKTMNDSQLDSSCVEELEAVSSRHELQQKLLEKAQQKRVESSQGVKKALDYLRDVFGKFVRPFSRAPPLYELFVYSDFDDVQSHLKGAPRGAIHTALTNPQHYLQVRFIQTRQLKT